MQFFGFTLSMEAISFYLTANNNLYISLRPYQFCVDKQLNAM